MRESKNSHLRGKGAGTLLCICQESLVEGCCSSHSQGFPTVVQENLVVLEQQQQKTRNAWWHWHWHLDSGVGQHTGKGLRLRQYLVTLRCISPSPALKAGMICIPQLLRGIAAVPHADVSRDLQKHQSTRPKGQASCPPGGRHAGLPTLIIQWTPWYPVRGNSPLFGCSLLLTLLFPKKPKADIRNIHLGKGEASWSTLYNPWPKSQGSQKG